VHVIVQIYKDDFSYYTWFNDVTPPPLQLTLQTSALILEFNAYEDNEWNDARGFQIRYSILQDDDIDEGLIETFQVI